MTWCQPGYSPEEKPGLFLIPILIMNNMQFWHYGGFSYVVKLTFQATPDSSELVNSALNCKAEVCTIEIEKIKNVHILGLQGLHNKHIAIHKQTVSLVGIHLHRIQSTYGHHQGYSHCGSVWQTFVWMNVYHCSFWKLPSPPVIKLRDQATIFSSQTPALPQSLWACRENTYAGGFQHVPSRCGHHCTNISTSQR